LRILEFGDNSGLENFGESTPERESFSPQERYLFPAGDVLTAVENVRIGRKENLP
jgi:hypothetical protein